MSRILPHIKATDEVSSRLLDLWHSPIKSLKNRTKVSRFLQIRLRSISGYSKFEKVDQKHWYGWVRIDRLRYAIPVLDGTPTQYAYMSTLTIMAEMLGGISLSVCSVDFDEIVKVHLINIFELKRAKSS